MEWERQRTYDFENGKEAGKKAKTKEDAIGFYENGVSIEIIAKSLKLSEAEVTEIIKAAKVIAG